MDIATLLRARAASHPDAVAVVLPGRAKLTYAALVAASGRLARRLQAHGVAGGDRVCLMMNRSIETIVAMCAVLDLGAIFVPIDPAYPEERRRFMLEDTAPRLVLTEAAFAETLAAHDVPSLVVELDADAPAPEAAPAGSAEDTAYIMYTSGSTGVPKGVCVPQRAITRLVLGNHFARLDDTRVWLQLAPISFDASTLEIWGPLLNGGTCVLYPRCGIPDLVELERVIRDEKVTSMWLTASLFNLIIDERPQALATVSEVLTGGEALSVPHVRAAGRLLPDTRLINGYGPTENTTFTCCHAIPRDVPEGLASIPIGSPIANTCVYILDDALQPVPPGEVGELCTGGDGLASGYWQRPELTAERFVEDLAWAPGLRLYRTGDRVRWLEGGVVEFLGRVDDQVKISGHRIEPGEIAAVLARHDAVKDAVVVVREDEPGEKRLVAYVVPEADEGPSAGALRGYLEGLLPDYMVPAAFVTVPGRFPITANGKIDRAALPAPTSARPELEQPFVAPRTELEEMLAGLWCELLHLDKAGVNDRFFELGGTSLKAVEFIRRLSDELGERVPMLALFDAPTVAGIAQVLIEQHGAAVAARFPSAAGEATATARGTSKRRDPKPRNTEHAIAIVGMAGRFPKADDIHGFWNNLRDGVEGTVAITPEDLERIGKDPALLTDPDYVAGTFALQDMECFDAAFFGISPAEAEVMDPQLRLMLETAWAALEHAGYDPARYAGRIGVIGGVGRNSYLLNQMMPHAHLRDAVHEYHMLVGNERDFPTTHISYRLNLRGPSLDVQTACSTSGVAIHLAAQGLRNGDADMELVGGCKVICPNKEGYWYVEGGPLAPEPHIRAFDAKANGMVRGSGCAMLVLKRLSDALADGDTIYGLLKGSAVNNDGAQKIGFTAPSIRGQAEVIHDALVDAGVQPDEISYVETHGTGTRLGDPIEIAGLTQAYRLETDRKQFCAVGSVKTNIGHLDAGATAAGVIKTLLAMQHEQLPPSLNYTAPNPEIDFANSPFFVNAALSPWPKGATPRRAGVSSFGLGGTNAHLILEEAPELPATTRADGPQLLVWSAKTDAALQRRTIDLGAFLAARPDLDLADVAHTLQVGRQPFTNRAMLVASSTADAAAALRDNDVRRIQSHAGVAGEVPVAFMFPGGGAQHVDMARGLYATQPTFRAAIDRCAALLQPILGRDIRDLMYPAEGTTTPAEDMESPALALPALFAVEFALARLLISWGVRPAAMIGHSMGEYTAACLAGVMTLEHALALVHCRGRLFETLQDGAMLGVPVPENEVLAEADGALSIAAVNHPDSCVASGAVDAIEALQQRLEARGVESRRVHIRVAAHSQLVEPILREFGEFVAGIDLQPPQVPFVSNVTGDWITAEQATDPDYWVRHLRHTVRFSDGLSTMWQKGGHALLEVGPGQTLATLAKQHPANPLRKGVIATTRHPQETTPDVDCLLQAVGRLWLLGGRIDWAGVRGAEVRRRVGLPTYPFARDRHWIDAPRADAAVTAAPAAITAPAPAPAMSAPAEAAPAAESPAADRRGRILAELCRIIADLSGFDLADVDPNATFLELGFDSLFLARANSMFKTRFGIRMTARQLIEKTPTLALVAEFLDGKLPADAFAEPAPAAAAATAAAPVAAVDAPPGSLQAIAQQLAALQSAIAAMSGQAVPGQAVPAPAVAAAPAARVAPAAASADPEEDAPAVARPDATSPWQPVQAGGSGDGLTERQRAHLDRLMEELQARTPESKRRTQASRKVLSDPRTVQGFRSLWKEIVYPIVSDRAEGARIWDVDGNEYIDLVNGYGVTFFGHTPDFILTAVEKQIRKTVAIGPQTPLAGKVAAQVCEMTGNERAAFCNTGSEAVLAAIRMARTVTGRKRLACFSGHYHGIFDEVLVKGLNVRGKRRTIPIAPGIPGEACESVIVMDYGSPEALETIRQHAHEIALVMMEPVRSREPEKRPVEFVRELRKLTEELDIPLLFDEMVTGFRSHPGGAKALWGIEPDLCTYGKVVGGGFPIGVVAGKALYMDALDGGMWEFGDNSQPEADMTWFAGTFVRHPGALAAASAVLDRLKEAGPALQEEMAARVQRFCDDLNEHFTRTGAPVYLTCFSSWFVVKFKPDQEYANLLFHNLIKRGIYTYGGRPAFITTEHTDADMAQIAAAFKDSVAELQRAGFFPGRPRQLPDEVIEIPMSDGQQEIWLATRFGQDASLAFNLASTVKFKGDLRVDYLRNALDGIVERHEALRAVPNDDGRTQRIFSPEKARLELREVDLRELDAAAREEERLRLEQAEVETPFDLDNGPLARATLVRTTDADFELILTAHHIVADGWSCGVLLRELGELYSAAVEERSPVLAPPMQLSEWVDKCEQDLRSEEHAEALQFWLNELSGSIPVLDLPADRARPPIKTFGARRSNLDLDAAFATRLKAAAARCGATTFVTLMSAFQAFIHRLSGQDDMIVGFSLAGQSQIQGRDLVGHCVNFLPLRQVVESGQPFKDHVGTTRGKFLDAMEHQDCTLGTLIKNLKLKRDPSRVPLMSVAFNLDPSGRGIGFKGVEARTGSVARRYENFDIFFNVVELPETYQIQVTYNEALWDQVTMDLRVREFRRLLESVMADPTTPLDRLELLDVEEQALLASFNPATSTPAPSGTLHARVAAAAAADPAAVAVVYDETQLTYAELLGEASRVSRQLTALGVARGDLVGVCMERSARLGPALLGTLMTGAAYVPLEPMNPAERLTKIATDAKIKALITEAAVRDLLPAGLAPTLDFDADRAALDALDATPPVPAGDAGDLAYVIYTSGSTGTPKGVQVTHGNVLRLFDATGHWYGYSPADVFSVFHSYAFDVSVFELWGALTHGARAVIVPQDVSRAPELLLDLLERERVTILSQTPSAFYQLLATDVAEGARRDLPLRFIIFAGEALDFAALRPWFEKRGQQPTQLINMYGITETTVHSTFRVVTAADLEAGLNNRIGVPIPDLSIEVVDKHLAPVPVGVPGEILVGGRGVTSGYLGRAELTAEKFLPDPSGGTRYRSGDVARWMPSGELEFLGRMDHQVQIRGFRIELGEIESVLGTHPTVHQAAATVTTGPEGDPRLLAYVEPAQGQEVEVSVLREHLRRQLPPYMVPGHFMVLDKLPTNISGKLDRRALPAWQPQDAGGEARLAPSTEEERRLAAIWTKTLGIENPGVEDDFFDVGGHSLLAVRMLTRIREEFGAHLSLQEFMQGPTIAALAELLQAWSLVRQAAEIDATEKEREEIEF